MSLLYSRYLENNNADNFLDLFVWIWITRSVGVSLQRLIKYLNILFSLHEYSYLNSEQRNPTEVKLCTHRNVRLISSGLMSLNAIEWSSDRIDPGAGLRGPAGVFPAPLPSVINSLSLSQRWNSSIVKQSPTLAWSESRWKMTPKEQTVAKRGRGNLTGRVGYLIEGDSSSEAWNGAVHVQCCSSSKALPSHGL